MERRSTETENGKRDGGGDGEGIYGDRDGDRGVVGVHPGCSHDNQGVGM